MNKLYHQAQILAKFLPDRPREKIGPGFKFTDTHKTRRGDMEKVFKVV